MAFTKIAAAGIGSTELVTLHSLEVLNNATVGGVLTYEDVTNVDSVGLITARNGIVVGSGITLSKDGDIFATGVTTTGSLVSSGAISGTTGTFSGAVSGTTGTFTGDVDIADKIIHTGDTNTAIRFPSADTITAETGGSERVRITSTGLFGIGTTPEEIFHVKGPSETVSSRDGVFLQHNTDSDAADTGLPIVWSGRISSGLTNYGLASICGRKENSTGGDGASYLQFATCNSAGSLAEKLRITSIGDVGVNVTPVTSRGPLHVHRVSSSDVHVHLTNTDTGTTANDGMSVFANDNHGGLWLRENGNMLFATNDTERVRIDSSGRVLIGLTASQTTDSNVHSKFQVASSAGPNIGLGNNSSDIDNDDRLGVINFSSNHGGSYHEVTTIRSAADADHTSSSKASRLELYTTSSGNTQATERLRIDSSGKVAIGNASPQQLLHVWPDTANTTSAYIRVTSGDRGSGTGVELGSDADGDGRLNVVSNAKLKLYTNNTQRFTIDESGNVGFGLGSSYAPETPIDVVVNWANTRSDVTTVSTYHRKLPLNERGDITLTARHSASKDGAIGYVGPIIDFRSTNSSNEEWTVAQLVGSTDPLGGSGYQGGLSVFASNGGNNPNPAPSGRRDQGDAPTLSTVIAPYRITTFCSTGNQTSSAIHITKNFAANNVQSDMIHFDVNGAGRGRIMSADSGSNSPSFGAYSDRRLKTNFRNYTGGYDRIKAIPVKLYDEVLNDQTKSIFGDHVKNDVIGWIADEVQSVFPEAVVGTKDQVATTDDVTAGISTAIGDPIYQSISEGRFLPDAIQAIQKLIEKVETLETKVAALEG